MRVNRVETYGVACGVASHSAHSFSGADAIKQHAGWEATLRLRFAQRQVASASETVLLERQHHGPLRIQKALYPEGPAICHAVILHPPSGLVGGDRLNMGIQVGVGGHAVLATPGASKWYRSLGPQAHQQVAIQLESGAKLDWLPQENIVFDGARARLDFSLECMPGASAIGWDAYMLGRRAAGESWSQGEVVSATTIRHQGRLSWAESWNLQAEDGLRVSPMGMNGFGIMASLWAIGDQVTPELAEMLSVQLPFDGEVCAGVSCLPGADGQQASSVLLVRLLGQRMEPVRDWMVRLWMQLRPIVHQVPAQPLRLWST